jgi:hypothetical protein
LERDAAATGFRAEILEKAIHLFSLLDGFHKHPFLKAKWALKGGTALNLFWFEVPRLSVDIDLNYIGQVEREAMLAERPKIEVAIQAVCSREEFTVARIPSEHAGGKWRLRYKSGIGAGGNLEVDVNFMLRLPLWPVILIEREKCVRVRLRAVRRKLQTFRQRHRLPSAARGRALAVNP